MDANTHPDGAALTGAGPAGVELTEAESAAAAADAAPWGAERTDVERTEAELADAGADGVDAAQGPPPVRPGSWPGVLAVVLAAACAGLVATGVTVALTGDYAVATLLAQLAIGCSIAAVAIGIVSMVLGRGRRLGIAGCVLGVLANPLITLVVLRTVDGI